MRGREVGLLGLGALCAVAISVGAGGCQPEGNTRPPGWSEGPGGTTGQGGRGAETASSGDGGREGGGEGDGGTATTGSAGGGGGGTEDTPAARVATIEDLTMGTVTSGIVELRGVVAMSPKFLVSQSNTGRCTYGVYLSAPGLTETEAYSGILAVDRGDDASTGDDTKLHCAKLGEQPAGGEIPDDVVPGDVLNVVGQPSYFSLNFCGTDACGDLLCDEQERACYDERTACAAGEHQCWEDCSPDPLPYADSKVRQRQLAYIDKMEKVGKASVPAPHVLDSQEDILLSSPTDERFHDRWGGVKVRVANVSAVPWSKGNVVNFGNIVVDLDQEIGEATLQVGNNIYYRGYAPPEDACHKGPTFSGTTPVWSQIDGFSTLDECIWTLQVVDPCTGFVPASESCDVETSCL
ncbi:hypothetical protein [Sorangium sp. So ce1335]|uniref:hypothetical protein n=1 Tax=Sorangium sp. So ce1335 TaxID=3133335 RepID=UPI003F62277C